MDGNKTEPAKYIPKNFQNQQDFAPKKIDDKANQNQNSNAQQSQTHPEKSSRPIQYNAFNFGVKKQAPKKQQRQNYHKNFNEDQFQPIKDYKPTPPKPESAPNPQPREFNPNYVPKLQPTEIIPKEKLTHFSINPALIVQKKSE